MARAATDGTGRFLGGEYTFVSIGIVGLAVSLFALRRASKARAVDAQAGQKCLRAAILGGVTVLLAGVAASIPACGEACEDAPDDLLAEGSQVIPGEQTLQARFLILHNVTVRAGISLSPYEFQGLRACIVPVSELTDYYEGKAEDCRWYGLVNPGPGKAGLTWEQPLSPGEYVLAMSCHRNPSQNCSIVFQVWVVK